MSLGKSLGSIQSLGVTLIVSVLLFRNVQKLGSCGRQSYMPSAIKNEWKMAKIAFVIITVYVLSWSPYACVTLIAWAG